MRRAVAVVALVLLRAPALAEPLAPRIQAPEPVFDAGTIDAGTVIRHTFPVRNAGDTDLHIRVQPGCACTVVQFDETIAPGALGTVTATLDTLNYKGRIAKEIRVASDDPGNGSIGLELRADVVPALTLSPTDSPLLRGTAAELKPIELVLASNDGQPFDVLRADADPLLTVHVAPDPGARPARTRYRVTIAARPGVPAGRSGPIVTLVTSHPHAPPLTVRVNLAVVPAVSVAPKHVVVHASVADEVQHVRISKAAGGLATLGVDSTDPNVVGTLAPVVAGHEYDLAVRYVGPPMQGVRRAQLTVRTNDSGQPAIRVSVAVRP